MKVIVATEKATGTRYGYCQNTGVCWFAPGLTPLSIARLPQSKAEQKIKELILQELVCLFRKEKDGISQDCETVNMKGFTITLENPM